MPTESGVSCEGDRHEPELRALIITIDVNVCRLGGLMAKEIKRVRTNPEDCRHGHMVAISNAGNKSFLTDTLPVELNR